MSKEAFRKFEIDKQRLSEAEVQVLEKLVEASRLIGLLFLQQENSGHPGGNFYPPDATEEEIREEAEKNELILDSYTVVERDEQGDLIAIPYHEKYKEQLEPIAALLDEAAAISENKAFAAYLNARAQSFRDDSWSASEDLWLELDGNKIDVLIGPIEPYLDDLFSVKYAFQANVRITSENGRFNPQDYLQVVRRLHATSPLFPEQGDQPSVQVRVDDVAALAGWHARLCPVGTNLPNDPEKVSKYGTKILIYTTDIELREGKITVPVLKRIFPRDLVRDRSRERILANAVRATMLHEITEAVVKYSDAVIRLGDMYTPVKELHASVVGIKSCTFHVLKGILSQEDYEDILMIFLSWLFETWLRRASGKGLENYFRGYLTAFNFFIEQGGLQMKDGVVTPDFEKLFVAVDGLASVLSHLMAKGSQEQARRFFEEYSSMEVVDKISPQLKDIPVKV